MEHALDYMAAMKRHFFFSLSLSVRTEQNEQRLYMGLYENEKSIDFHENYCFLKLN